MKVLKLVWREAMHRKVNTLLALVAIMSTVTLYIAFYTMGAAANRETIRIMRDLGYNLRIIPKGADETAFWAQGYASETMPEAYVQNFATAKGLSYRHLLATLQQEAPVGEGTALLTGIASDEVSPPGPKKSSMIFSVAPGEVYVGYHIAQRLGVEKGDTLPILGKDFQVAYCMGETGSVEDVRVYGALGDVQALLGKEGLINEIQALECLCVAGKQEDMVGMLREQLKTVLPEAKVIELRAMAAIRQKQRSVVQQYLGFSVQAMTIICALWLAVLALLNVRERRHEIGVLRALGYGSLSIAGMVQVKALFVGLIGAALGFAVGSFISLSLGPEIFKITAKAITVDYSLLGYALILAPLFSALCSLAPSAAAVMQDPAETLRDL